MKKLQSLTNKRKSKKGFTLVELLMTIMLFAILSGTITVIIINFTLVNKQSKLANTAYNTIEESSEALRSIRDQNFLYLTNGPHGLNLNKGIWSFSGESDQINNFYTRTIIIADVYRDGSSNITTSGGSIDERTKAATIQIAYSNDLDGSKQVSTTIYLSDWTATELFESDLSDWNKGALFQTRITPAGSLELDATLETWQNTVNTQSELFENNFNADGNAIKVEGDWGYFVSKYQGNLQNFNILDISNLSEIETEGSISLGNSIDGLDLTIQGNYAYVGTDKGTKELMIIDISNKEAPTIANSINLNQSTKGLTITSNNTHLFLGLQQNSSSEVYIFDLQNPTNPSIIGQIEIGADINDLLINGNELYIVAENTSSSLHIYNIQNPASPTPITTLAPASGGTGKALAYKDNTLYFGSSQTGSDEELILLDISTPSNPTQTAALELGTSIRGLDVFDTNIFITSAKNDEEFTIINATNPLSLSISDTYDLGAQGNKLLATPSAVFVPSNNNTESSLFTFTYPVEEFFTTGTYTSQAFNSGSINTVWLTLDWTGLTPANTTVDFHIKTADTQPNLNYATWVGTDGTTTTSYTALQNIITTSPTASGTQWFQFQITLTSPTSNSPEITGLRIQYAP
jgi:prepilin-type N-terminal cleavage/methylation domain-containing protein